jgi:hypothetical protein
MHATKGISFSIVYYIRLQLRFEAWKKRKFKAFVEHLEKKRLVLVFRRKKFFWI